MVVDSPDRQSETLPLHRTAEDYRKVANFSREKPHTRNLPRKLQPTMQIWAHQTDKLDTKPQKTSQSATSQTSRCSLVKRRSGVRPSSRARSLSAGFSGSGSGRHTDPSGQVHLEPASDLPSPLAHDPSTSLPLNSRSSSRTGPPLVSERDIGRRNHFRCSVHGSFGGSAANRKSACASLKIGMTSAASMSSLRRRPFALKRSCRWGAR